MVFKDHVRKGKKLFPSWMANGYPIKETTWHVERLPELYWLALIIKRLGYKTASDLVVQMTRGVESTITHHRSEETVIRAYLMSEYLGLSTIEKQVVVDAHRDEEWLKALGSHFADLVVMWPEFPAAFLASERHDVDFVHLVNETREVLKACLHRHDVLALITQATTVESEIRCGHLTIEEGLNIPDLNAIVDYPHTEESKEAAGFVVTTCNSLIMGPKGSTCPSNLIWQRSFWNRCYKLQPCEYD